MNLQPVWPFDATNQDQLLVCGACQQEKPLNACCADLDTPNQFYCDRCVFTYFFIDTRETRIALEQSLIRSGRWNR